MATGYEYPDTTGKIAVSDCFDPATVKIEKVKVELGGELVADYSRIFSENLQLNSKPELFSSLQAIDQTDINRDTRLTAKVSKYINTSFNLRIFYDSDISARRQMKQTLALGIAYVFI